LKSYLPLGGGRLRYGLLATTSLVSALAVVALVAPPAIEPADAASCADNVTGNSPAVTNSSAINCISINGGTVAGNVTNTQTGTITAGNQAGTRTGILVANGTVAGSVVNNGTITAPNTGGGINVTGNSNVAGGVTNTGSISGNLFAIQVENVPTFAGGITNGGTIVGKGFTTAAINVSGLTIFSGGIINTGRIGASQNAISVSGLSTFAGGVSNSGLIHAHSDAIIIDLLTNFSGGISNTGTLSAATAGIAVAVSTFAGGIDNSGTITASLWGVRVENTLTFQGGINNGGTIKVSSRTAVLVQLISTFAGGITNSGTISGKINGIEVEGISNFSGGITNAGSISGNSAAIQIKNVSTFAGGITNNGTITGKGFTTAAINVSGLTIFSGGIINTGQVGASQNAVSVTRTSTFTGGVSNSGLIHAGADAVTIALMTNFSGGISNGGTLSAGTAGVAVTNVSTFVGGITNSGTIKVSSGTGIVVKSSNTPFTFSGGITNTGTISSHSNGIAVVGLSNFSGGLTNAGSIAVSVHGSPQSGAGLLLSGVSTFAGGVTNTGSISVNVAGGLTGAGIALKKSVVASNGVTNTGTISVSGAGTGVGINIAAFKSFSGGVVNQGIVSLNVANQASGIVVAAGTVFSGGISNSGSISAGVGFPAIGITVANVSTFLGGISNTGLIFGLEGILISHTPSVSVFDSGTIIGTGGTAIAFGAGPNTLTLGPGFSITGNVLGSGSDVFQLGGAGAGAFNLSTIGAGLQYQGFTTFNVISADWVATGTGNESWTVANGATLQLGNGGSGANAGAINGNVADNGTFAIDRSDTYTYAGALSGGGVFVQMGSGTTALSGNNSYSGGTLLDAGTLQVTNNNSVGTGAVTFNGGTFQAGANGVSIGNAFVIDTSTATIDTQSNTLTLSGPISDGIASGGGLTKIGSGTLVLSGASGYIGATNVNAGALQAGAANAFAPQSTFNVASGAVLALNGFNETLGALSGAGNVTLGAGTLTAGGNNSSTAYSGTISGSGGLNKTGSGIFTLTGTDTYTGVTNINGGTLNVTGAITSSSAVNVNAGGTLTGTGTVDPNTVTIAAGATFAPGTAGVPGSSTTIAGNLAFQSGALYAVYLNATMSSFANVTGSAALAGSVSANFTTTSFASKQHYTILQSAGLNGTTFSGVTTNLAPGFGATLTYSADDVFLNVIAALGAGTPLNQNQQGVANGITAVFNSGSTLPASFLTLFNLTGAPLANALTQLDGEDATGAEHGAIELTNEFLSLMLDPFVYGRGGPASGGALGFAPDQQASSPSDVALAYGSVLKAPPASFAQRWTVWGAGYGGSATFDGNAAVGSTDITASTYGFAAGADYHAAPDMVLGFALAGAGTNWGLANTLGTGRSDAFQAGVYGTKYFGPAYLGAALAFTNNWFTTNRVALGDQLTASFQGQSFGARIEGGYRYAVATAAGVTPYAAIQAQSFRTPSYSETDLTGGGFGLSYSAMSASDTRSELGARFDAFTAWGAIPVQLRARVAWAHDWVSNPALDASFQALPGTSSVVNGAPVPHNSALTSVGAELHLTPQWSLIGKFDGEFAASAQTYAGSGTLRYRW